jgi:hypothetical protein
MSSIDTLPPSRPPHLAPDGVSLWAPVEITLSANVNRPPEPEMRLGPASIPRPDRYGCAPGFFGADLSARRRRLRPRFLPARKWAVPRLVSQRAPKPFSGRFGPEATQLVRMVAGLAPPGAPALQNSAVPDDFVNSRCGAQPVCTASPLGRSGPEIIHRLVTLGSDRAPAPHVGDHP